MGKKKKSKELEVATRETNELLTNTTPTNTTEGEEVVKTVEDSIQPSQEEISLTLEQEWELLKLLYQEYKAKKSVNFDQIKKWYKLVEHPEFTEEMFLNLFGYTYNHINEFVTSKQVSMKFLRNQIQNNINLTVTPSLINNKRYKEVKDEVEQIVNELINTPRKKKRR